MNKTKVVILGSTGSIGEQTLEIVRDYPDRFEVLALSCHSSWEMIVRQAKAFKPKFLAITDTESAKKVRNALAGFDIEIMDGSAALCELAELKQANVILNALVGFAGFEPTVAALKAGQKVALANKESLVVGGALINTLLEYFGGKIIPVDSEHSAIYQCLKGEEAETIEKLVITASGGPFRSWNLEQMQNITVDQALDHPNWDMGAKITIDSATMMNKGLEVIEAHWLFGLSADCIQAVIHPQSIIHSIVTFVDGSSKAQLGPPTMKVPILYALTEASRIHSSAERLDWGEVMELNFEPVDYAQFPCFKLALDALQEGGNAPTILNAANEIAVQRFLEEEISYIQIADIIEASLNHINRPYEPSVEALKEVDAQTRQAALTL